MVTSDMEVAFREAEMIMVVVPSSAHADIARAAAPYVKDGQIIILHPGRTCGAIEFDAVLRANGCKAEYILAEAETFHLCQPLGWPGPGAHLPHQGSRSAGSSARLEDKGGAGR